MTNRWWIYQRERFPFFHYGLLVIAVCLAAIIFSWLGRGNHGIPPVRNMFVAIVSAFLFFLQLRIFDEFKDYVDDLKYRPYRPVPRGLVLFSELKIIAAASAGVQLGLALWLNARLILVLVLVWGYMLLMAAEFFAGNWLKKQPVVYLISHMLIMPLIYLYITACDWWVAGDSMPTGIPELLGMGFINGFVMEIGRKIRPPEDEETGVETYSRLWGPVRASLVWIATLLLTALFAGIAVNHIHFSHTFAWLLGTLFLAGILTSGYFCIDQAKGSGKRIEKMSGIWILLLHLGVAGNFFA